MTSKGSRYLLTFLILTILYSSVYIAMIFIPELHVILPPHLILGAILLVAFVLFKGVKDRSKNVVVTSVIVLVSLIIHFAIDILDEYVLIFQYPIIHTIIHVIFGVSYFLFSFSVYYEFSEYNKRQKIKLASMELNVVILLEYNNKKKMFRIEIPNQILTQYQFPDSTIIADLDTIIKWVPSREKELIKSLDEGKDISSIIDAIFHVNIGAGTKPLTIQIKSVYSFGERIVCLGFDYAAIEKLEMQVVDESMHRTMLIDNMLMGFAEHEMIYDDNGKPIDYRYIYVNKTFCDLTGWKESDIINHKVSEQYPIASNDRFRRYVTLFEGAKFVEFVTRFQDRDTWYNIRAYRSGDTRFVSIFHDVTELKRANDELEYQSTYNVLTGLMNYHGLELELARHKRVKSAICFYVTIDGFEEIEAFYGTRFTQLLVGQIAHEFDRYVKVEDIVANTKYHHFILILLNPTQDRIDKTFVHAYESVYRKHTIENTEVYVKQNIGYSTLGIDTDDLSELVALAQIASHEASKSEHNIIVQYHKRLGDRIDLNMTMAKKLYEAIESGLIDVHFQKIINSKSNGVDYLEALARWTDSDLGYVSPIKFFDLAVNSAMIDFLDAYLIKVTLRKFKKLLDSKSTSAILSMNLSSAALYRTDIVDALQRETNHNKLLPKQICLEISENTFVGNLDIYIDRIRTLKNLGYLIAIDDFGSKYSSLGILETIPYDIIKLDGIFSKKIRSTLTKKIVETLIDISVISNKVLIAEGVETTEEAKLLIDLGCYVHQGYYYHKPEKMD